MTRKESLPLMRRPNSHSVLSRAGRSASVHPYRSNHTFIADMATPPTLPNLPLEIIQKIFLECSDIVSVLNLSATSHRLWEAYDSSQKLLIIENALEAQFSPLYDAIQVVTYSQSQSEEVYFNPVPPMSMALARQIAHIGNTAQKWEQMYPMLRWRDNPEYRRLLNTYESFRFRRALYRLWLYTKAFHNDSFLQAAPTNMIEVLDDDQRLVYLSQFDDDEMMEIRELNDAFQSILVNDLCPSDAIIQQRYNEGFPGQPPLYFGSYHAHPIHCYINCFCHTLELRRDLPQAWAAEAWGPRSSQMRIVERLLKFEPDQLLYFKEELHNRAQRVNYLRNFPLSFHQHRSTLEGAMINVISERNYELKSSYDDVYGGILDYHNEKPGERNTTSKFSISNMRLIPGQTLEDAREHGFFC